MSRTRRFAARGATLALASAAAAVLAQPQQDQRPAFRAATDVVNVPVFVRANGVSLAGLTADDFVVTDNGVPQKVQVLSTAAVPADITLIVDTSEAMSDYLASVNAQVKKIAAMIRPTDRFELIGVSSYVEPLLPMRPAAEQRVVPALVPHGLCAINDALVAALLREPDGDRPHLIIALSDTVDTMSTTTMETVRETAKYSSSILTIAWTTMDLLPPPPQVGGPPIARTTAERRAIQQQDAGRMATVIIEGSGVRMAPSGGSYARSEPLTGGWLPHYEPRQGRLVTAFDPLKEAAELTGGALYLPGVFAQRTASAVFDKVYGDYRSRYLLRYEAAGVSRDGWHDISVAIPKRPGVEISARRGYFVDR